MKYLFYFIVYFSCLNGYSQINQTASIIRPGGYPEPVNRNTLVQGSIFNYTNNGFKNGLIYTFNNGENIKGTRFMFTEFVTGKMYNDNTIVNGNIDYLFNYDKTSQTLVLTTDNEHYFVPKDDIINLIKITDENKITIFEKIPQISKDVFVVQLEKKVQKYSLYKSISTKFRKAKQQSTGLIENDDTIDEYVDKFDYYIVFDIGRVEKIKLNKKDITDVLKNDSQKVKDYLELYKNTEVDEKFLINLIVTLNN
jgi:hypothetical protein